jgi:hypothetical protein
MTSIESSLRRHMDLSEKHKTNLLSSSYQKNLVNRVFLVTHGNNIDAAVVTHRYPTR